MLGGFFIAWLAFPANSAAVTAQSVPILSLTLEGTKAFDPARLKGQLRMSREGGWYQPEILKTELQNIERYCQEEGYLNAKIGPPQVELQTIPEKGEAAVIRVPVSEGPLYTLGELGVKNANTYGASTLVQMSPLRMGQPYSRKKLYEWREKIAESYQSMGYIRFEAELHETIRDIRRVVDCILECKEGNPYQVGRITIVGLQPAEHSSFKRRLLLGEGGLFNPEMLPTSLYFINGMGLYRPMTMADVEVKINDAESTVDLVFHVVPAKKSSSLWPPRVVPRKASSNFFGDALRCQEPQTTFRTEVALVNVIFSAADRNNRVVAGLKAEDLLVFEDKQPQKIEFFGELGKGTEVPLTVALLIDTSGSVKTKLGFEKETAAEFFKNVLRRNKDLALIIQFDSDVNLVQDFTEDPNLLIRALDTLQAGNSTALYDAIFLAVDEKLKHETGRKVIVVITDGEDTSSKFRKEVPIEAAQKSDVLIYGIGVRSDYGANFGVLKKFAEETGGLFFSPRSSFPEVQAAFRAIGEDLKGQYSLAYSSTNKKRDGSFRTIEVRGKVSGIRIRTRKGYYAPRENQKAHD